MVNKMKVHAVERGEHVGTRVSRREIEKLDALVEAGMFLNRSDAVRTAVRQMVGEIKIASARRISKSEAKGEILNYLSRCEKAYPSDIADELELDYDLVRQVLQELRATGEASPA